ncbi:MAG TPA: hypothetical protein VM802_01330 [Chitinophaga sp.]|uniref:hypothetical protein n=1 Tax=Chitinophaga sp. TaxID=1869181 RepID=UPI002C24AF92|nr:hypothetical protein [Chitinophaga sp.]HVI43473.1 hypothetical protein [Chitinophaga sp.]
MRKEALIRRLPLIVMSAAAGLTILLWYVPGNNATELMITVALVVMVLIIRLYMSTGSQQRLLASYTVTISDDAITREQYNTPPLSFNFIEILQIAKDKDGNIFIRGMEKSDVMVIPSEIERYEELESILQRIKPFADRDIKTPAEKYRYVGSILLLVLMMAVYLSGNKIIVGSSAILLTALLIWQLIQVQRNRNAQEHVKRRYWVILLVMLAIIAIAVIKIVKPEMLR